MLPVESSLCGDIVSGQSRAATTTALRKVALCGDILAGQNRAATTALLWLMFDGKVARFSRWVKAPSQNIVVLSVTKERPFT